MSDRMNMETLEQILKRYGVKGAYLFGSQLDPGLAFLDGEVREIERSLSLFGETSGESRAELNVSLLEGSYGFSYKSY